MSNGIVTIADANFFDGVVALANSIRINSPAPLTVIDQGFLEDQVRYLEEAGVNVIKAPRRIRIDSERFGCCFALFDIDSAPYDNILYIDADTLVLDDISELFELIDRHGIVCAKSNPVRDFSKLIHRPNVSRLIRRIKSSGKKKFFKGTPFSGFSGYFRQRYYYNLNSGVVGVKKDLFQKIIAGIDRYRDILTVLQYPDQELLALLLADAGIKCHILPYQYNATRIHTHPDRCTEDAFLRKLVRDLDVKAEAAGVHIVKNRNRVGRHVDNLKIRILHFNTEEKPWRDGVILREGIGEVWKYYRKKTACNNSDRNQTF